MDLPKAVIIEAVCSFIFHSALLHFQEVRTKLRIHLLSALITFWFMQVCYSHKTPGTA